MEIKLRTNVFTVRVKELEGKVFEQFLNTELNDKENERKEEGEWEGDDRNWLSDDGEPENSAGEEEVEKSGAWKNSNKGGKFEESFVAESRESVQEGKNNNGNKISEQDPPIDIQGGDSPSPKKVDKSGSRPRKNIGFNASPFKENEGEPLRDLEEEVGKGVNSNDITALLSGEVSDKLKKLLSRNVPIEEKLVMVGKDLTDTQRKIMMKEGRVNNFSGIEKRITSSQSENWKKKNEAEANKKGGENDIDSDSSMSIGILQRLEEVGKLSGLRKGDEGGVIIPRSQETGANKVHHESLVS
ncbi:hypothetical protein L2E82_38625 [Cichorium intybus]|uniref:Uncharacterized protein n=1 Tax=Cichorium intybus TaxID=13427 RepID=A0ACB9AG91_CICIN|nr:hypothetical protein L2E82_38625 [Cichorium intybus]